MPASKSKEASSEAAALGKTRQHTGDGALIVLSGPSGVGKGTVVARVLGDVAGLTRSVSVTTRKLRMAEQEGVDYFFTDRESFENMKERGHFIESAEFAGNYYGTPRKWVEERLAEGLDVLLVIEVQGAKQVRESFPDAVMVFLSPPSMDELEKRLRGRGTESEEKISLRLKKAGQEMTERNLFHYEVVNDDVDHAVTNLLSIVYAERCRIKT